MASGKLGGGLTCFKYMVVAFNVLFCIIGLALLGVSIFLMTEVPDLQSAFNGFDIIIAIPIVGMVLGFIITICSLLGCCGAFKENSCLLKIYFVIMIIMFLIEVAVIGAVVYYNVDSTFENFLNGEMSTAWAACDDGQAAHGQDACLWMPALENELKCCSFTFPVPAPSSGQPGYDCVTNNPTFTDGCQTKVIDFLKTNFNILAGVLGGVVAIQIIVVIGTCCLISGINDDNKYA